jgi:hypothetical protein
MYLIGRPHPHKVDAQRLLERCIADGDRLFTDVEVFQEILHRYTAIDRRAAIQPAFDVLLGVVDEILSVDLADIQQAKALVLGTMSLSARDALHVAVMQRHGVHRVLSFDRDLDLVPGLQRLH